MFAHFPFSTCFNHILSMLRIRVIFGWLLCGLCVWQPDIQCSACSSQKTGNHSWNETVDFKMERALENKEDDLVTLPFPFPPVATTPAPPSGSVLRPHLGEDASFPCPLPVGGNPSGIIWTVQGRTVFEHGQPVDLSTHYEFAQWDDVAVLRIRHVALASSGEIVCRLEEGNRKSILRRFTLIPRVTRAAEVFATPLASHHEAAVGASLTISCPVRLPLSPEVVEDLDGRYLWRHNGWLVNMTREAQYMTPGMPAGWTRRRVTADPGPLKNEEGGSFIFNLEFSVVRLGDRGILECWFRPHKHLQEWIVQSTNLEVEIKP
ncbi:uncharacterized protein LOC129593214 [Paramacrobiotus metropolitanus]|uniref:uncharacterized protein LOC129593214 n=1 Tax=Paramacrobiotus metropolitanus TaxID=2943436 RepID=UPI002445CCDE|nr:uncharacterized protein LOC129593214 [Paramacrobiotus metropolitanus]